MTTDTAPIQSRWARIASRWPLLNHAQKFYAVTAVLAVINMFSGFQVEPLLVLLGICAITALVIDIWYVFEHLWHRLAGKAFLVAIYLCLANYCYALAQSQVNSLVGIRPDLVPHSVHLNLFLMAPIWCFLLAFVVMMFYSGFHVLKAFLMLLLRPFGVRSHHISDEAHPVLFVVLRILLLPVTIVYLGIALSGYIVGGDLDGKDINFFESGEQTASQPLSADTTTPTTDPTLPSTPALEPAPSTGVQLQKGHVSVFGKQSTVDPLRFLATPNLPWIDHIVAGFLYHVESMGRSNCRQQGDEHVVYINDYEVLVITPKASEPTGYQFVVRACNSNNIPKVQVIPTPAQ